MPLDSSSNLFQMEVWLWDLYARQTLAMSRTFFFGACTVKSTLHGSACFLLLLYYTSLNMEGRMGCLFLKVTFALHWHSYVYLWLFLLKEDYRNVWKSICFYNKWGKAAICISIWDNRDCCKEKHKMAINELLRVGGFFCFCSSPHLVWT